MIEGERRKRAWEMINGFFSLQKAFLHSSSVHASFGWSSCFSSLTSRALDVQIEGYKRGSALYNRSFSFDE
jgi:hypothetical protein